MRRPLPCAVACGTRRVAVELINSKDERLAVDNQVIERGLEPRDVHGGPGHSENCQIAVAVVDDAENVVIIDIDRVGRVVADSIDPEVDVDLGDAGSGRIVDVDRVGAAKCIDGNMLDVGEVHHDVALNAGEQGMVTAGRQCELLPNAEAVEQHLVEAASAIDTVAAIPLVPTENVVSGAENADVGTLVTVEEVIAFSPN